jgi:hypothetical protein
MNFNFVDIVLYCMAWIFHVERYGNFSNTSTMVSLTHSFSPSVAMSVLYTENPP